MAYVHRTPADTFSELLKGGSPEALAFIRGARNAPYLNGRLRFFEPCYGGALIEAEIFGLPEAPAAGAPDATDAVRAAEAADIQAQCAAAFYVIQIGGGSLLPLISRHGYAWLSLYDQSLSLPEIIEKPAAVYACRSAVCPTTRPAACMTPCPGASSTAACIFPCPGDHATAFPAAAEYIRPAACGPIGFGVIQRAGA